MAVVGSVGAASGADGAAADTGPDGITPVEVQYRKLVTSEAGSSPDATSDVGGESPPVRYEGTLHATETVWDQQLGSSDDLVFATNGSQLVAYDSSGTRAWSAELGGTRHSEPISDGDVVAVAVRDDLRVFDAADGTLRWSSATTTGLTVDEGPVVVGEYVYVTNRPAASDNDTTVYAYHRENGTVAWYDELGDGSRPPIALAGDGESLIVVYEDEVRRLNATTGTVEWDRADWPLATFTQTRPAVENGTVYVTASFSDTHHVYAFDLDTGVPEWRTSVNDDVDVDPVAVDGTVYVASGQTVHALDAGSGEGVASYRTDGEIETLAHDGGTLYAGSLDGKVYALEGSLAPVWTYDLPTATGDVEQESWVYGLTTADDSLAALVATDSTLGDSQPGHHSVHLFRPTDLVVTDIQVNDPEAAPGDTVTASATVSNEGNESATSEVTFAIDGPFTPVRPDRFAEPVSVPAGGESLVTTDFEVATAGEYNVTAFESGTDGLETDVRPGYVVIDVRHASPDHDWKQDGFDRAGSDWSPLTNAPAGPFERVWAYGPDTTGVRYGHNPALVEDGLAFVHNDTNVAALDVESGTVEWEFEPTTPYEADQENVEIGSHAVADGTLYFTMIYYNGSPSAYDYRSRIYALDSATGTGAWGTPGEPYVHFHDRSMNRDVLVVDGDRLLVELYEPFGNRTVQALHQNDGALGANHTHVQESSSDVISTGDHVIFEVDNTVHSLDGATLAPVSSRDFGTYNVELASDGEDVYVATGYHVDDTPADQREDGTVYALTPADLSDERWNASPTWSESGFVRHQDVLVTDELVVTAAERMYAFDRDTGDVVWEEGGWNGIEGVSYVTAADGVLYATGTGTTSSSESTLVHDVTTGAPVSAMDLYSVERTVSNGTVLLGTRGPVMAYRQSGPPEIEDVELATVSRETNTAEVTATVTNPHDHAMDDLTLILYEGASSEDRVDFDLDPGETKTVTATFDSLYSFGDYSFHVAVHNSNLVDSPSGMGGVAVSDRTSLTVEKHEVIGPDELEGVIAVDPRLEDDEVWVGETLNVTVDLVNLGDTEAERTIRVEGDPSSFRSPIDPVEETVTVPAGATETVRIPVGGDRHNEDVLVALNGTPIGTIDILDDRLDIWIDPGDVEVEAGTTVPITVDLENEGNVANETTVDLAVDGEVVGTRSVVVEARTTRSIEFEHTFEEERDYELSAGSATRTVTVGGEAQIQVQTVRDEVDEIEVGEPVPFVVEGANFAEVAGDVELALEIDGEAVTTEEVFVPGKSWSGVTSRDFQTQLNWTFDEPGEYAIGVNGVTHDEGSVTVVETVAASFTHDPERPIVNETVTFDASNSSSPDGAIVEYRWDFTGDGQVDETTSASVIDHTFEEAGEHDVTLEVEDETGETDETTATITVDEPAKPSVPIEHTTLWARSTATTDDDGVRRSAEVLAVTPSSGGTMTFGSGVDRSVVIRHPESGARLEVTPLEGEGTYEVTRVVLDVYDGAGEIDDDPTVEIDGPDGEQEVAVSVTGDEDVFTGRDSTFASFEVALLEDGDVVGTTDARLVGIGYLGDFEQDGTADEITVTLPRDEGVDAAWHVEFSLVGTNVTRVVEHGDGDDVFEFTVDVSAVDSGDYTANLEMHRAAGDLPGERILNVIGGVAVPTGSEEQSNGGGGGGSGAGGSAGSAGSAGSSDDPDPRAAAGNGSVTVAMVDAAPDEPGLQVSFDEDGVPLEEVSFDEELDVSGEVSVEFRDDPPASVVEEFGSDRVVSGVDIEVPDEATDSSARIRFHLTAEQIGDRDPTTLEVVRVVDGGNQRLPTDWDAHPDGGVVIVADTPGFSSFAIVAVDDETAPGSEETTVTERETTTSDAPVDTDETPDPTPTRTAEPGGQPGFGMGVAVVSILLVVIHYRHRRR